MVLSIMVEGKDFISFLSSNFLNFPIQAIENGLSTVQYTLLERVQDTGLSNSVQNQHEIWSKLSSKICIAPNILQLFELLAQIF